MNRFTFIACTLLAIACRAGLADAVDHFEVVRALRAFGLTIEQVTRAL